MMKEQLIHWLNQLLMADVFLVLLSFFWLAIAVVGRSLGLPLGLDLRSCRSIAWPSPRTGSVVSPLGTCIYSSHWHSHGWRNFEWAD